MKNRILALLLLISGSLAAQNPVSVKLVCDKTQSNITYAMNHPLHAWTGECREVNSIILMDEKQENMLQVAVSAKLSTFDSKNANRDSHMMEVTEALKYPNATFSSKEVKLDGANFEAIGTLMFHGVGQPIIIKGNISKGGNKAEVTGEFTLKMTQFKIDPPSLMGISTDDEFKLTFKVVYLK